MRSLYIQRRFIQINHIFLVSKWHEYFSFCGLWNWGLIWQSHQFHKKQGWGLILATHTFLIKHVCNLMTSYLNPSVSATDFSWQVFFTLMRVIFHAISTVKCQTIILSDPRMCLITRQILSYHSQLVLKTIRILSGYYQVVRI